MSAHLLELALVLAVSSCTSVTHTTDQGDQSVDGLVPFDQAGEAASPSADGAVVAAGQLFQANGVFYRDHGADGYCRFVDLAELACQTGVGQPATLPEQPLPGTLDRGPCYVRPTCWSGSVTVSKGDLLLRGEIAAVQGEERYLAQKHLVFAESSAQVAELYAPFWGADAETWDDTFIPLGWRCLWTELEIATADGTLPAPAGGTTVILTPTDTFFQVIDQEELLNRYAALAQNGTEPLVSLFFKYLKWSRIHNGWMANRASLFADWSTVYQLDLDALPEPEVFVPGGDVTDLLDADFWNRRLHSGSRAAWSLIWGWHTKTGTNEVRDLFLNAPSVVAAVDAVFPGRLAAWLEQQGFFAIRDRPATVTVRLRHSASEAWKSTYMGRAPLTGIDLQVTAEGPAQPVQLAVYCRVGEAATLSEAQSIPFTRELDDLCSYDVGHHVVVAELMQNGALIARHQVSLVADPASITVQKGDVLVFGTPATSPLDHKISGEGVWQSDAYNTDAYLAFVPTIGMTAGVYAPFFGEDLRSWDDSSEPLGQRYFWGHVELASEDGAFPVPYGLSMVVLRPTAEMLAVVDILAAADKLPTVQSPYSQPFVGVFLRWLKWSAANGDFYGADAEKKTYWAAHLGINLDTLVAPTQLQFAPQLASEPYTDITGAAFWQRDVDCSSLTMWSLIWGWHQNDPAAGTFFRDNLDAVAAIDALSPGQVAWWLQKVGYTTRVY